MAVRVTNDALQMHGAHGYMTDSPVQRYFRDARMLTISEGSSEIQHINLARGLGLKADDYCLVPGGGNGLPAVAFRIACHGEFAKNLRKLRNHRRIRIL